MTIKLPYILTKIGLKSGIVYRFIAEHNSLHFKLQPMSFSLNDCLRQGRVVVHSIGDIRGPGR